MAEKDIKRVLLLIDSLECGGAERIMTGIANYLCTKNIQVTIVTLVSGKPFFPLNSLISVIPLSTKEKMSKSRFLVSFPILFVRLLKAISKAKAQVNCSFLYKSNILNLAVCFCLSKKTIVSERTNIGRALGQTGFGNFLGHLVKEVIRFSYNRAGSVICISKSVAESLASIGVQESVLKVIHNPIVSDYTFTKPDFAKASETFRILAVGRLVTEKSFDLMLEAFSEFVRIASKDNTDFSAVLDIVGSGPALFQLKTLAVSLKIDKRVNFLGLKQQPFACAGNYDLFLNCSSVEGFGNVVIEAMSAGLPIISTVGSGGPAEILDSGKYGILVENSDTSRIARELLKLVMDRNSLRSLSQKSLDRAKDFELSRIAESYLQVFGSV